jgi:hypothetical protein
MLLTSAELAALCAKLTRSFDPTAAAMLLYARDEIAPDQKAATRRRTVELAGIAEAKRVSGPREPQTVFIVRLRRARRGTR